MEPPTVPTHLPSLQLLPPSTTHTFTPPAKLINSGPDVEHFLTSKAYRDICTFVLQLNRSLCPRKDATKGTQLFTLSTPRNDPAIVTSLQSLLAKVESIISEAPPDPGPRRFGNISFRRWHEILEGRVDELLKEYLPEKVLEGGAMVELKAYFIGGFGSSQRMDYGTGHELSFVAFLGCLWKLGAFKGENVDGEVERSIVLGIIEPYLKVIRKLILTYTLEPAGSHGVWGLDDHSFLPYVFGSAQFTRPIARNSTEPMPLEGSCPGAPKPADIVKADKVSMYRDENMYFSAVGFINDVKSGPFWEHSPILFDVSGIKDGWGKINKGMVKMFNAEVLSKFPVVQHFPFGSMFSWERDPNAIVPVTSVHMANQPTASAPGAGGAGISAASSAVRAPGAPGAPGFDTIGGVSTTTAPWAAGGGGITYARVPPRVGGDRIGGGNSMAPPSVPVPRGGAPDTGPPPPSSFPRGVPGQANNQFAVTKAPWAKD